MNKTLWDCCSWKIIIVPVADYCLVHTGVIGVAVFVSNPFKNVCVCFSFAQSSISRLSPVCVIGKALVVSGNVLLLGNPLESPVQ